MRSYRHIRLRLHVRIDAAPVVERGVLRSSVAAVLLLCPPLQSTEKPASITLHTLKCRGTGSHDTLASSDIRGFFAMLMIFFSQIFFRFKKSASDQAGARWGGEQRHGL